MSMRMYWFRVRFVYVIYGSVKKWYRLIMHIWFDCYFGVFTVDAGTVLWLFCWAGFESRHFARVHPSYKSLLFAVIFIC